MLEDERPPERIWLDDEALSSHWEQVENKRKAARGSEAIPEAPGLEQNELTAGIKAGR